MITLLTAAETQTAPAVAHRFMAELASRELELDAYGIAVSKDVKTVDLLVTVPDEVAIKALLAATDWLAGYSLVRYWQPEDGCLEF